MSQLVHDYIAGYERQLGNGATQRVAGHCPLFRNFDPEGRLFLACERC